MKLYETISLFTDPQGDVTTQKFREFTSSATEASKVRTRLKKLKHEDIQTEGHNIETTRDALIKFLNERLADPGWVTEPVADAVGGAA